jgi:hypothetical protein
LNGVDAVGVLYGLEAINAHKGWAILVVGVSIVFTGLVTLSALISQLHKLVALYDDPGKIKRMFAVESESAAKAPPPLKSTWCSPKGKNRYAASITFWPRTWAMSF